LHWSFCCCLCCTAAVYVVLPLAGLLSTDIS
jgi:hypothetical protein